MSKSGAYGGASSFYSQERKVNELGLPNSTNDNLVYKIFCTALNSPPKLVMAGQAAPHLCGGAQLPATHEHNTRHGDHGWPGRGPAMTKVLIS
jgi:hypothetical protein